MAMTSVRKNGSGSHRRVSGRRVKRSRLRRLGPFLTLLEAVDSVLDAVVALASSSPGAPASGGELLLPGSSGRIRTSWKRSLRQATDTSLPRGSDEEAWVEHRVGVCRKGRWEQRYIVIRPSAPNTWEVVLSARQEEKGYARLYPKLSDDVVDDLLVKSDVRWFPVGVYADAITNKHFQDTMESSEPEGAL